MTEARYQIGERLGMGGLGEVFSAWDPLLQRHVALKRLSRVKNAGGSAPPDGGALREAVHLAALQHPNVVTVHDCGSDEAGPFLVMELVQGETLEEVVQRGAFPLEDFKRFVKQALEGLAAAHEIGLLHCDLKPGNIMLKYGPTQELQVKLLDFGIAGFTAAADPIDAVPKPDNSGTVLGTVEFMSPEQFERQPISTRSELYSMGCIFYYALTGKDPFQGKTMTEIMASHLEGRVQPLAALRSDLPEHLCKWITRLLSRNPDARPATVLDALAEFNALFAFPSGF